MYIVLLYIFGMRFLKEYVRIIHIRLSIFGDSCFDFTMCTYWLGVWSSPSC